jgi:hypothetical protein
MPYRFAARGVPLPLRACRSLLWAQAAYTLFAGIFVLMTAVLLGGSFSIPFRDGTLNGGGATILGVVYIVAAATLAWLAFALVRREPWATPAIAGMEVFLAALQLLRGFDVSPSTLISVALYMAILVLLFTPGTQRPPEDPARA